MRLTDFDYRLPKELIAQYPAQKREESRLLVLQRKEKKIRHRRFGEIIQYLLSGDCLVLNNTKVICARLWGKREKLNPQSGGGKQEIFFLERIGSDTYRVLAKPAKKLTTGSRVLFAEGAYSCTVLSDGGMVKTVKFEQNGRCRDLWSELGRIPLPPYIRRPAQEADKERYQTVYAQEEGATAAPTAGLHFTKELMQAAQKKGVRLAYLTLHINYGTFSPVKCEDITKHKMHKEYFILPADTAAAVNATRASGGRIMAVGTTSVRVLETSADDQGKIAPASGWTDLFIYPPYRFRAADCLLTNFHFPKSTLLMLVSAFAGKELVFKAYQQAIKKKYRFFSYGDAMLIV